MDAGFRILAADRVPVLRIVENVIEFAIDFSFQILLAFLVLQLFMGYIFKFNQSAVAEKTFDAQGVVPRTAIDQGMGAAGVVADHAADHAAIRGGGLGAEEETMGFEIEVEFIQDHAGLHANPVFGHVQFHNGVHESGNIDDYASADHLSGQ